MLLRITLYCVNPDLFSNSFSFLDKKNQILFLNPFMQDLNQQFITDSNNSLQTVDLSCSGIFLANRLLVDALSPSVTKCINCHDTDYVTWADCGVPLTHWGRIMHICISKNGRYWFRLWLVACAMPNHYLNQSLIGLMHWSYCSLALSHPNILCINGQ